MKTLLNETYGSPSNPLYGVVVCITLGIVGSFGSCFYDWLVGLLFWLPVRLFLFGLPYKSPYPLITNESWLVLP